MFLAIRLDATDATYENSAVIFQATDALLFSLMAGLPLVSRSIGSKVRSLGSEEKYSSNTILLSL